MIDPFLEIAKSLEEEKKKEIPRIIISIDRAVITEITLMLIDLKQWLESDAKFSKPDSKIRSLRNYILNLESRLYNELRLDEENSNSVRDDININKSS